MLPKHFTFYCPDDHTRMIYTAKKQGDGLFKVTWKESDNWMEYDESGMDYHINQGNWRIIPCIDDEEPQEPKQECLWTDEGAIKFTTGAIKGDGCFEVFTAKPHVKTADYEIFSESLDTHSTWSKESVERMFDTQVWTLVKQEPKEEIVRVEKLPDDFVFQIKESNSIHYYATRSRLWGERCMFLVEWHYDGQDCWKTYTEDELCNHFNNYGWKFVEQPKQSVVSEQPNEGPAYSLSEAQAFCAANGAVLLISENKFVLNHPGSGISYCVPSVEDLQRAVQWLRDYLEEKANQEIKKEIVNV